jgi:molecular chaperone GrpE (heat shock protein)
MFLPFYSYHTYLCYSGGKNMELDERTLVLEVKMQSLEKTLSELDEKVCRIHAQLNELRILMEKSEKKLAIAILSFIAALVIQFIVRKL